MALFCIMSGYLFATAYIGNDNIINIKRIKKQLINLLLLYIIWCIVLGLFKLMMPGTVNHEVKLSDFVMIWCKPIGVFWWLYVLIAIYCLSIVLLKFDIKIIVPIVAISGIIGSILPNDFLNEFFMVRRIFYYLFFFWVGILLCKKITIKKYTLQVSVFLIAVLVLMRIFWSNDIEIYHIPVVNIVVAFGICLGFILLANKIQFVGDNWLLCTIGEHSLEIYTLHIFLTAGSRVVISKLGIINLELCFLVTTVLSVFIPLIVGVVLKKINLYNIFYCPVNTIRFK
jgi:hypothetical protein